VLVGSVWIILSDHIVSKMFESKQLFSLISILKGWMFVVITGILLYFLIRGKLYTLHLSESKLQNTLEELQKTNAELSQTQEKLAVQYKKLAKNQAKIRELSFFDSLTGLPNKNHFQLVLEKAIKEAYLKNQQLAIIYIDIDNLNKVNNTLGHIAGDSVLKKIANRLKSVIADKGFVARLTGDEFAIILYNFIDIHLLDYFIRKFTSIFNKPWKIMDYEFYITASIGIAIFPNDGNDATTLLENAHKALNSAKEKGKNIFCFYNKEMDKALQEQFELEWSLRKAIEQNQFKLFYQPIIDLKRMKICGAEALIRWIHPEKGFIPPLSFIPIAEQTGLISKIGEWVISRSVSDLKEIKMAINDSFYVSVNVSLKEFSTSNFVDNVLYSINSLKIEPTEFGIEITESVAMVDPQKTIGILNFLKERGIKILLDDFGTGYSSLNYLKQLPIDIVKIDRSFIQNMTYDQKEQKMAKSLIDLSHILDLKVVAEGIEDERQAELLKTFSCDFGQGYLFGKPMPKEELLELAKRF